MEKVKRPEGMENKRSRMFGESKATKAPQERKITTAVGKAKRSECLSGNRSRMFGKSEATKAPQERKITTAERKAKRPEGMQRINEMKRNYAILAIMAVMIILSTGCRAQKETPAAAQSSPVQSSPAQTETAENSEEVIDSEQLEQSSEIGTSSKPITEEEREKAKRLMKRLKEWKILCSY